MTPLETLKAARDLISDPSCWTQGDFARNTDGQSVDPNNKEAMCFCAFGAIQRITENPLMSDADRLLESICNERFSLSVGDFNDTHTHAEVLALFDAAIAELEAQP